MYKTDRNFNLKLFERKIWILLILSYVILFCWVFNGCFEIKNYSVAKRPIIRLRYIISPLLFGCLYPLLSFISRCFKSYFHRRENFFKNYKPMEKSSVTKEKK